MFSGENLKCLDPEYPEQGTVIIFHKHKASHPYHQHKLPKDGRELYRLYYTERYSQGEIAERKNVSQNTISKKLRRIKKQLTEMCRKAV